MNNEIVKIEDIKPIESEPIKIGTIPLDISKLTPEDMPNEVFRDIAELCGMNVAVKLLSKFQGNLIQVPTNGFVNIEKKIILACFDGTAQSIKVLARNLIVTEKYIRDVLKRETKRGKIKSTDIPVDGQISFIIANNIFLLPQNTEEGEANLIGEERNG